MSLIERDRAKALGAMRHAITTQPASWTPDDVLDAVVDSGAVVWASNHRGAVEALREIGGLGGPLYLLEPNQGERPDPVAAGRKLREILNRYWRGQ